MKEVLDFFRKILDTSDWPPRWHCGHWSEFHGWLYIISDLLIWSAYFALPIIILRYTTRRKNIRFHKVYFLFAAFILACGSTHFIDAVIFWFPAYRLSALIRFITGVVSWFTILYVIKMLPVAFSLKTQDELEKEIEQRKQAEGELLIKNRLLNEAEAIAKIGHWQWDVASNKISWSDSLYKMYDVHNLNGGLSYEKFINFIHPEDRIYVDSMIKEALEKKTFRDYFHRIITPNGTVKTMHSRGEIVLDANNDVVKMIGTGQDVSEQKKAEQELLLKSQQLETMNLELEKFAYVASHDLQEPLRKIIMFSSLIEKNYQHAVDERGVGYIQKVIASSSRMQKLINDILYFSRVKNQKAESFEKINLNDVFSQILNDLEIAIERSGASISISILPEIDGNASQLGQLFQNLISNAIKFRKPNTSPQIVVSSRIVSGEDLSNEAITELAQYFIPPIGRSIQREDFCEILIEDNGIGFEQQYAEKIFTIFQRLHSKTSYEGTGIGLAICKKIVESHNGYISASGKAGEGAKFTIILPLSQKHF